MDQPPRPRRPLELPPRPEKRLPLDVRGDQRLYLPSEIDVEVSATVPPPARAPAPLFAELDEATRERINQIISRAIAAELGSVRISSVPPPGDEAEPEPKSEPPPRSSMRVAARGAGKVGKWTVFASGAISIIGSALAWWRPEYTKYAAPLGQALKLIGAMIASAGGSGPPMGE